MWTLDRARAAGRLPWPRIALLTVVALLALGAMSPAAAQSSPVIWEQFDFTFDIQQDGTVHVTEYQLLRFDGSFTYATADIPLDRVESIENVSVTIGGEPARFVDTFDFDRTQAGTYTSSSSGGNLQIQLSYPRTSPGDTREVVVEYDLIGAIRVYENLDPPNQQFWWVPISSDISSLAPIASSTVSVVLPEDVPADQIVAFPENPAVDGRTYSWTRSNLSSGDVFEVRLQFPPITAARVPAWQAADDEQRQAASAQADRDAVAGVLLAGAGLLTLVGGVIGFTIAWYTRGRDPHVGAVAEYMAEPPDDLSPGAAGTLIDEKVETRDVLAVVLDLARRGVIAIHESGTDGGMFGLGASYTHEFELKDPAKADHAFEQKLLDVMFLPGAKPGKRVSMAEFRQAYTENADVVAKGLYDELVAHRYVAESPEASRKRWNVIAFVVPAVIVGAAFLFTSIYGASSGWMVFLIIAAVLLWLFGSFVANRMPVKTLSGAEAAAKWRAFRTYLDDIDEREDLQEARDIFDRYLPYAVAFGLERSFVQKFAAASVPMPGWFEGGGFGIPAEPGRPMRRGRRTVVIGNPWLGMPGTGFPGGEARTSDGGDGGGGFGFPDLQDMSDRGGGSLQGGSDSFFDMLNTAAEVFSGSSSGGSRGSFGSFRGGGGFSGGGGFGGGGGGGGGSRGFG